MKPSEHLTLIEEALATPDKWTKGELGRDDLGMPILLKKDVDISGQLRDPAVCSRCLMGALWATTPDNQDEVFTRSHKYLLRAISNVDRIYAVAPFNDDPKTTHEQVIRVIRMAKQEAQRDESRLELELIRGA